MHYHGIRRLNQMGKRLTDDQADLLNTLAQAVGCGTTHFARGPRSGIAYHPGGRVLFSDTAWKNAPAGPDTLSLATHCNNG